MSAHFTTIERMLSQLDQKYLDQVEAYIEYLVFLQQKESIQDGSSSQPIPNDSPENDRLNILRQFKGDAPFPEMSTSKYDVYEQ